MQLSQTSGPSCRKSPSTQRKGEALDTQGAPEIQPSSVFVILVFQEVQRADPLPVCARRCRCLSRRVVRNFSVQGRNLSLTVFYHWIFHSDTSSTAQRLGFCSFTISPQHRFPKATYQNADEPELSFVTLHKPRGMDAQGSVGNKQRGTRGKREDYEEHQGWKEVSRTKNMHTHNGHHIFLSGVTTP